MDDMLLHMQGITKTFPGVTALSQVDFKLRKGEVHALMGENGAGKSTLIKVLTGVYPRDAGTIIFNDEQISSSCPGDAEKRGISCVYQEINLIPHLSVAENIVLGRQEKVFGFLNWEAMYRRAEHALQRIGLAIDVKQELGSCSVAVQQMVAIARALDISAQLLILDEPTSSLDEHEVDELFNVMRSLKSEGLGIVFVTHFLDQVYQVSDRITVLRNGELVGEFPAANLPRIELVAKMLGRNIEEVKQLESSVAPQLGAGQQEQLLAVSNLGRKGAIFPFDMVMAKGEVLGLAGLLGSGRTEIARLLFGIDRADSGTISLVEHKDGIPVHTPLRLTSPRKAIDRHIAFCSEDRKVEGIIPSLSVRENIIVALQARRGPFRPLPRAEQERIADTYISVLDIKTPSHDTPVNSLSGGNQQKVLLARWLAMDPHLMILDEPTRGIDVGAKAEIEKLVQSLSREGMSILFISSELEEVVRNCQRLLVLRDRRKIGELEGEEIGEHTIMNMIAGIHEE